MSSYHVLNTLWIGIFPMLVVSLIIGITIYLLCCLIHIKKRCVNYCHHRKTKQKRELKKKFKKSKNDVESNNQHEAVSERKKSSSSKDDNSNIIKDKKYPKKSCFKTFYEDYYDDEDDGIKLPTRHLLPKQEVEEYLTVNNEINPMIRSNDTPSVIEKQVPPPLPLTVPPPQSESDYFIKCTKQERLDRSCLTLNLKTNNNNFFNKPKSIDDNNPPDFIIDELDSEPVVLAAGLINNSATIRTSMSLNINEPRMLTKKKEGNNSNNNIEQLIVHELKESPKGIYARLKSLRNIKKKMNPPIEPPIITDLDRSPNSGIRHKFLTSPQTSLNVSLIRSEPNTSYNEKNEIKETNKSDDNISLETNSFVCSQSVNTYEYSTDSDANIYKKRALEILNHKSACSPKRLRKHHKNKMNKTSSNNSAVNSPIPSRSNKKKNKTKIRNRVQSDFEIEENKIFNEDDNDSISSYGLCNEALKSQIGSQGTLTNRSISNLIAKKRPSLDDNDDSDSKNRPQVDNFPRCTDTTTMLTSAVNQLRSSAPPTARINFSSSISDIDPDDNILNNMLIKKS